MENKDTENNNELSEAFSLMVSMLKNSMREVNLSI